MLDINDNTDTASKGKKKRKGANPNRGRSKNVREKMKPVDSGLESEDEEGCVASQSSVPDPSSSRRKRVRPPDDYHDLFPAFSPASSPIAPTSQLLNVGSSSKKQKLRR